MKHYMLTTEISDILLLKIFFFYTLERLRLSIGYCVFGRIISNNSSNLKLFQILFEDRKLLPRFLLSKRK